MRETKLWTWFMLSGLVLLLLLGMHMLITHTGEVTGIFVANGHEEAVSKANSQARDAKAFFPYFFVLMLAAGLFHGLYGLRTILFELTLKPALERTISVAFLVFGIGLFSLGTWAAFTAHAKAVSSTPAPQAAVSVGR